MDRQQRRLLETLSHLRHLAGSLLLFLFDLLSCRGRSESFFLGEEHLVPNMFWDVGDVGEVDDGGVEEEAEAVEGLYRSWRKGGIDGRGTGWRRGVEESAVVDCG